MPRVRRSTIILIVDDDQDGRDTCGEFLEACDFAVLKANNGAVGLAMAVTHRPDLILMDLDMPTMGGLEALRRLKADARTQSIPVVVLTGRPESFHAQAEIAGSSAYLVKPCAANDLEGVVRAVIAANEVVAST